MGTQEQPKEEEEEETEVNEDGEVVAKRKDGKDGPWNKLGDAPSNQSSMEEREEIPEQKREAVELFASSNVGGGSYRCCSHRSEAPSTKGNSDEGSGHKQRGLL